MLLNPEREVFAVVAAAGLSRRCPPGKLFLPWDGKTVLETTVGNILAACPAGVVVVLGHRASEARRLLEGMPCAPVFNPRYREGMGTSVAAGIRYWLDFPALPPEAGILLQPGDTPFIPVAAVAAVVAAYREKRGEIVAASHLRRRGHPVIFHRRFAPELEEACLRGGGAREVLRAHSEEIWHFPAGPEVLDDLDTLEDYRRRRSQAEG